MGCIYSSEGLVIVILMRAIARIVFLLLLSSFMSCHQGGATSDAKTSSIDTGSAKAGATMVSAMYAGRNAPISFTTSAPIVLSGEHDRVINGSATQHITLIRCSNITIKNCKIGPYRKAGISLLNCTNIKIDSCYLYYVSTGIYAGYSTTISITNCQAKNMVGPFPEGQFVQFNVVKGGGNRVSFNKLENVLGQSNTEDAISMHKSDGLPADPIVIESNWIKGGGPSRSGGGIMLGDGGGSYMVAKNNILVDPGQYGMAVSGGSHMSIVNNTIYAKAQPFTNNGIYYRNLAKLPTSDITIAKNEVNYTSSKHVLNNTYLGPGELTPTGWNTNVYNTRLNENILPAKIVSELISKNPFDDLK